MKINLLVADYWLLKSETRLSQQSGSTECNQRGRFNVRNRADMNPDSIKNFIEVTEFGTVLRRTFYGKD